MAVSDAGSSTVCRNKTEVPNGLTQVLLLLSGILIFRY